ncbi:MAG: hypothetical protein ISR52_04570 [Rhodospirillales bacterium]|nr:hypothetical protein [Rhodospirillales bacterium]
MHYYIKLYDEPDSGAIRDATREPHLKYLDDMRQVSLFVGPILTEDLQSELGSMRLIDLPDRAAAQANVDEEPYHIAGLQKRYEIYRWSPSVPFSWRDCPRTEGNVQYLIEAHDKDGADDLRDELRAEHEAFQAEQESLYITRGPLMSDDGARQIGSLMIIDVPDLAAARKFWDGEPFNYGGLFSKVNFYGWRFGRVMDKFKVDPTIP